MTVQAAPQTTTNQTQFARGLGSEIFSHIAHFTSRKRKQAEAGMLQEAHKAKLIDNGKRLVDYGNQLILIAESIGTMPVPEEVETPPVEEPPTVSNEVDVLKAQIASLQNRVKQMAPVVNKNGGYYDADGTWVTSTGRRFKSKPMGRKPSKVKPEGKR